MMFQTQKMKVMWLSMISRVLVCKAVTRQVFHRGICVCASACMCVDLKHIHV